MSKQIPTFPNPFDPTTPLVNAYGKTSSIALDLVAGTGSAAMNVYASSESAAAGANPYSRLWITFGETLVPAVPANPSANPPVAAVPSVKAATVEQFLALAADPTLAAAFTAAPTVGAAWAVILAALDTQWALLPALTGSTEVP